MSLISESRCLPLLKMSPMKLALLLGHLAEQAVAEHLGEADDGVERRAQLVRHVGEELRLHAARVLELDVLLLQRLLELEPLSFDLLARGVVGADQQVADDRVLGIAQRGDRHDAGSRLPSLRM